MTASATTNLSAISLGVPVVDSHSHVIADDPVRYPLAPMGGKQSEWSKERPVNGFGMAQAMKEAGVAKSVLVQASTCYGHDNSYTLDCVKANTSQFIGVYSVDTLQPDAVVQVKHWKGAGLSGMRVFIAGHTAAADHSVRLDDPRSFPVWEYISEHHIPMCVQLRADGLPQLETLLKQFPKATVLLDHFARPVLEEGAPFVQAASLFALAKYPNLNFKFTTHNVRESKEGKSTQAAFIKAVVSAFGANRIAWGSNFPASAGGLTKHLHEALEATASLSLEEQRWIYSGTAHALYPDLNKS
jgi:predicted TIM-barrel fold metal-dependent hydrolase